MPLPSQAILVGNLESAVCRVLPEITESLSQSPRSTGANPLAGDDPSSPDFTGLLDSRLLQVESFLAELTSSSVQEVVTIGCDALSWPRAVADGTAFPPAVRCLSLASTDPADISTRVRAAAFPESVFLLPDIPGKFLESQNVFQYLYDSLIKLGIAAPGRRFVSFCRENSYRDTQAAEYRFRMNFRWARKALSPLSPFSSFGLLQAALAGINPREYVADTLAMRAACGRASGIARNPAQELAAVLLAARREGRCGILFLASPSLLHFARHICHRFAAEPSASILDFAVACGELRGGQAPRNNNDWLTVFLRSETDSFPSPAELAAAKPPAEPLVDCVLSSPAQAGAEYCKWSHAISLACAAQPLASTTAHAQFRHDPQARAGELLDAWRRGNDSGYSVPRLFEAGVELHVAGAFRHQISNRNLPAALQSFFQSCREGLHLELLAFLPRIEPCGESVRGLRENLESSLGLPVQLFHGSFCQPEFRRFAPGANFPGRFLVLTAAAAEDLPIPSAGYTFGQLQMARALAETESLAQRDLPVVRLHFPQGAEAGLLALSAALAQALPHAAG